MKTPTKMAAAQILQRACSSRWASAAGHDRRVRTSMVSNARGLIDTAAEAIEKCVAKVAALEGAAPARTGRAVFAK